MAESTNIVFGNKQLKSKNRTRRALASLSLGTIVNFLVFLLVILALLGLFVFKKSTVDKITVAQGQVALLQAQRDRELESLVQNGLNQQAAAQELLTGYRKTSRVLGFFEKATLPLVSFSSITYSSIANTVTMSGNAATYSNLAQQIAVFRQEPVVTDVRMTKATLSTQRGVNFQLQVDLDSGLLLLETSNANQASE